MPYAETRLEILQVRKLIQCARDKDVDQIEKMIEKGIPDLLSYQGEAIDNSLACSSYLLHYSFPFAMK